MRIDVHHHHVGEVLWNALLREPDLVEDNCLRFPDDGRTRPIHPALVDDAHLSGRIEGWDQVLISTWIDAAENLGFGPGPRSIVAFNDELFRIAEQNPRVGVLGALSRGTPEQWLAEIKRCNARGAAGLIVPATQIATAVTDEFSGCWSEIERCALPIVIHPSWTDDPCLAQGFQENIVGNPFQTSLAACQLLQSGVSDRHPGLRIVLAHGGGFLPYQIGRLQRWWSNSNASMREPLEALRWFWYDTILLWPPALRALCALVGTDRVLAGTDNPFPMCDADPAASLIAAGITNLEAQSVLGGNAASLFAGPRALFSVSLKIN